MSFSYSPKIVTDGLVLYLDAANVRSYPTFGVTWSDLSRNTYTGLLTNGPTFTSDNLGSILFDGIDDYVDFGTSGESEIRNSSTITISIACYCTGYSNPSGGVSWAPLTCIDRYNLGYNYRKFSFYLLNNLGVESVVCEYFDGLGTTRSVTNVRDILNNFFILTTTIDSSFTRLYVNGTKVDETTGITLNTNPLISDFTVGSRLNTSYNGYFKGNIFNFLCYNRALSETEVEQNYQSIKTRFGL